MKRPLSYFLFISGLLLLSGALLFLWHTTLRPSLSAVTVPDAIAGIPLSGKLIGEKAVTEIQRMHGVDFPMTGGAVAVYGDQNIILWVSGTSAKSQAEQLIQRMEVSIAEGRSPFTPNGVRVFDGHAVYDLTGLGQRHFYFQSGDLVIWLAADEGIADRALKETLQFYP